MQKAAGGEGLHYSALTHRAYPSCIRSSCEAQLHSRSFGSPVGSRRNLHQDLEGLALPLVLVLDTYSRKIVGWSMTNNLTTESWFSTL